ncbi:MAG: Fe-S cluster assembly protein SufD [Acidobacteria bacterium]|nr:Fe-S cluster assembly protein SufD [Acidobacteriota bacterium]
MMSQATKEKSQYRSAFEEFAKQIAQGEPLWAARLREGAMDRFEAKGFPTTDLEDWKYTNVAPIVRAAFRPASNKAGSPAQPEMIDPSIYTEAARSRLVFVNGVYSPELSSLEALPAGVVLADFATAFTGEHADLLRESVEQNAAHDEDAFAALNTAFLRDGAFLLIPKGVSVEAPILLLFISTSADPDVLSSPRVVVVAERDSAATIIESYSASGDAVYFTNAVVDISLGDNARVTHYKVQDESLRAFHVASTRAELGRGSAYNLTTITLGAQLSRHGIEVLFEQEGAECWVDGLYMVGTGQHADTHSLIDHRKAHCTSHQNYKGILDGKSRAVFNGRVFVHRDAQQTDAMQSNKNLLLSTEARVDTKPQLEIYADDVKCAHGATVGQLEEEELFYLASRGLHANLARNLLTYGFAEEIVDKIKIGSIKAQLDEAILNRLHARLEA